MSWSAVVEFPAVDATAEVKAAWIAAAEADADWWADGVDSPWPDTLVEVTPGQLLAGLAAGRVDAVPPSRPADPNRVDPSPGPAPADLAGWVRQQWWSAEVRDGVRALLTLPPGAQLQSQLVRLGPQGRCLADHSADGDVEVINEGPDAPAGGNLVDPLGLPVPGTAPGFPCTCQLLVAAAWEACASWSAWQAQRAVVDVVAIDEVIMTPAVCARGSVADPARDQLAPMLALSPDSTGTRIDAARDLATHPDLAVLIEQGLIFTPGVRAVLAETANLDAESRATVVSAVVAKVRRRRDEGRRPWTASELRKATKAAVLALAREAVARARRKAYARRRTSVNPDGDGTAWFSALIRDVDAQRIANRLTAQAAAGAADRRAAGDDRTADQVRADLLVDLLLGRTPADLTPAADPTDPVDLGDPGHGSGRPDADPAGSTGPMPRTGRPEISVVCNLAMLLGLAEDPGEVPGLGPVPADVARELAADGRWRLLITDPSTGQVIATGSRTYAPSAALARLIRAREPSCRMPGCNRQSANCDLDHTVPFPSEPGTVAANLGPLCRRDHNLKTHHGFHLANEPPPAQRSEAPGPDPNQPTRPLSGWTWTMPSGLTHTDHPDPPLESW